MLQFAAVHQPGACRLNRDVRAHEYDVGRSLHKGSKSRCNRSPFCVSLSKNFCRQRFEQFHPFWLKAALPSSVHRSPASDPDTTVLILPITFEPSTGLRRQIVGEPFPRQLSRKVGWQKRASCTEKAE